MRWPVILVAALGGCLVLAVIVLGFVDLSPKPANITQIISP